MKFINHKSSIAISTLLILALTLLYIASGAKLISCTPKPKEEKEVLTLKAKIPMPKVSGRLDHIAYDAENQRAYVAALGNNTVEVVDVGKEKYMFSLRGSSEPQGLAYIPAYKRLAVANGGTGLVNFYDCTTNEGIASVDLVQDADDMVLDTSNNMIYVGYGSGGIAMIDANTMVKQPADIKLDGHPEAFCFDFVRYKVYVNVPSAHEIQIGDLTTSNTKLKLKNKNAESNYPMAIDVKNSRLFAGFRSPAKLEVIETVKGNIISNITISDDADDLFYDEQDSLLFVSCGSGFIDVIKWKGGNEYSRINQIATAKGARTCLYLPQQRELLLAVPKNGKEEAGLWVYSIN
jgi:DNA-binding beta-propeller fold protein YncE